MLEPVEKIGVGRFGENTIKDSGKYRTLPLR